METENTGRRLVKDAVKAAAAAAVLILIGLVLTAGIFGADYGVRKAQAQTRQEMSKLLDGYGMSEEQKEEFFRTLTERIKTMLETGELQTGEAFGEAEREQLRTELAEEMREEYADYISWNSMQKIINEIWAALEQQGTDRETLLKQVTAVYEQYTQVNEGRMEEIRTDIREVEQVFQNELTKEIAGLREKLSDQIRVHTEEIDALQKEGLSLRELLEKEKEERTKAFAEEQKARLLQAEQITELGEKLLELTAQVKKNTEDIEAVFQLVSNGKTLLAAAITDGGIETAADAAFETMAEHIRTLAEYQFRQGAESAPAAISEFYLNLHYWDNSGPLHNCWFSNYVTFRVDGAESVTIGSIRTSVEGKQDKDFADLNVQVALDGKNCATLKDVDNYTILTQGASTMTLRMANGQGDERFFATAVVRDLKLNPKKSVEAASALRMRKAAVLEKQPTEAEFEESGLQFFDADGKETDLEKLVVEWIEEEKKEAGDRVAESQSENSQSENSQTENGRAENVQTVNSQTENGRAENVQAENSQTETEQAETQTADGAEKETEEEAADQENGKEESLSW